MSPRRTYFPADLRPAPEPDRIEVWVRARPREHLSAPGAPPSPSPVRPIQRRNLPDLQPWLQRECERIWNTHEARGRAVPFAHSWPRRSTFKALRVGHMPTELIVADWKIRATADGEVVTWQAPEAEGRQHWLFGDPVPATDEIITRQWPGKDPGELVAVLDEEMLDPPADPPREWASVYRQELDGAPGLEFALTPANDQDVGGVGRAITWLMKRLRSVPAEEQEALHLYLAGETLTSISRHLTRRYHRKYDTDRTKRLLDLDAEGRPRALRELLVKPAEDTA